MHIFNKKGKTCKKSLNNMLVFFFNHDWLNLRENLSIKYSRLGCSGSLTTIILVTYPKVGLLEFYLFQWKDKFFLSLTNISFCKKLLAFIFVSIFEPHDPFRLFPVHFRQFRTILEIFSKYLKKTFPMGN